MPTLKQNEIFANRYQLIKKLGVGGYSEVWLVKDNKAGGMEVALKIYSPEKGLDDKGLETFSKEFSLVFNLNHAGLLKPSYFDDYEGSPYLVMPYCKNSSMADKIGNITENEISSFIYQAASALAYLHEQQPPIIHQDIKPDNFLIDNSGNYLLADFGISSKIRRTLTRSIGEKASTGTMAYMPPEKFNEDRLAIKAGDIFSLGVCMFELLTGELAFGDLGGLALKSGADLPKLPESFSKELNSIIRSCLAKDPWDRPTAEMLMEIAKNYELIGKWDITKLPIAKQEVVEEPVIIPNEAEKQESRKTVQNPVNESDYKSQMKTEDIKNTNETKTAFIYLGFIFLFVILSTFIYMIFYTEPTKVVLEQNTNINNKFKIGDTYAGGIIFYLDETGQHGIVCTPYDQSSSAKWDEAKELCNNLDLNGYNDWYLPTKKELELMYKELYLKKIVVFADYAYWSSSEDNFSHAWYFTFKYGNTYTNFKSIPGYVRAVRAF